MWSARYLDEQKHRQRTGTYWYVLICGKYLLSRKLVRESKGRESVNKRWSGSLRWPVGGARLRGIGAEGPEHHSFLLRMSVRKGHAVFVWAAAYFLSQSLFSSLFPLSLNIILYLYAFYLLRILKQCYFFSERGRGVANRENNLFFSFMFTTWQQNDLNSKMENKY